MMIIDRDGGGYEVALMQLRLTLTVSAEDVLNGNKLFSGLRVTSVVLENF